MYTITSLNTQSCSDSLKRFKLLEHLKKTLRSDIYLLHDTHTVEDVEPLWRILWRDEIIFSHKSSSEAGLAILINPKSNVTILSHHTLVSDRILYAKIRCDNLVIHVFNVYAIPSNAILDTYDFNDGPIFLFG